MMKVLLVMMLCVASLAWAFKPGDELWVREEGTPVFKEPKDGRPVLVLEAGEVVKWLGPSEKNRAFHLVKVRGQTGYVRFNNLTPNAPGGEKSATFAAPVIAPPQLPYGTKPTVNVGTDQTRNDLAAVEELNRQVAEAKR
ncbi:MAG: hypothetical protein ACO1OB_05510 [Archangium sp.]